MGNSNAKPKQLQYQNQRQTSNFLIKQSRTNNVGALKLQFQLTFHQLTQCKNSIDQYELSLRFQSLVNFQVTANMYIKETYQSGWSSLPKYDKAAKFSVIKRFKCPQNECFEFPNKYMIFSKKNCDNIRLINSMNLKTYPLILELSQINEPNPYQLLYFFQFVLEGENLVSRIAKESIYYHNDNYEVMDLYGVDNTIFNAQWSPSVNEDRECVVCFSNNIDTIILPCRHMCVCYTCCNHISQSNSRLCPLCRKDIINFITIEQKNVNKVQIQQPQLTEPQGRVSDQINIKPQEEEEKQLFRAVLTENEQNHVPQFQSSPVNDIQHPLNVSKDSIYSLALAINQHPNMAQKDLSIMSCEEQNINDNRTHAIFDLLGDLNSAIPIEKDLTLKKIPQSEKIEPEKQEDTFKQRQLLLIEKRKKLLSQKKQQQEKKEENKTVVEVVVIDEQPTDNQFGKSQFDVNQIQIEIKSSKDSADKKDIIEKSSQVIDILEFQESIIQDHQQDFQQEKQEVQGDQNFNMSLIMPTEQDVVSKVYTEEQPQKKEGAFNEQSFENICQQVKQQMIESEIKKKKSLPTVKSFDSQGSRRNIQFRDQQQPTLQIDNPSQKDGPPTNLENHQIIEDLIDFDEE